MAEGSGPLDSSVEIETAGEESAGWDALTGLLAGFVPDQVPALVSARELEPIYPLLHALSGRSLRDFLLRMAVLEAVITDGRSSFLPSDVAQTLYWLSESGREQILRTLRTSGWLEYDSREGYRVTDAGRFVANILSFLRNRVREGSLLPTVEGIDYMLRLGVDPVRQVMLLRADLENLRGSDGDCAQFAFRGHSQRRGQSTQSGVGSLRTDSRRTRASPAGMADARRAAQDVHELLSRLHGVSSDLHQAITEVGRQYLHLVAGLTTADIIATLMRLPLEELADVGRSALKSALRPLPLLIPELLAADAESYLARQRESRQPVEWITPPEPEVMPADSAIVAEVAALLVSGARGLGQVEQSSTA